MKTILAFETSCPLLSVALGTREGKIFEARARLPLQHSENLIPLVDRLLRGEKISLNDIDAFAIDRGPGSFTGLRIGFSLLKGFLAVKKRPCYGAFSLDMIISPVRLPEGSRAGILVDARRDAIYARFYQRRQGDWAAEGKLELLSFSGLKTRIHKGTILMGDALTRYRGPLEEAFGDRIYLVHHPAPFSQAATLVRWFQTKDKRLSPLTSQGDFTPLYFRTSEAEENKNRRKLKSHAR